jgi:peptidyl-prolyl cis-trans isomerase C
MFTRSRLAILACVMLSTAGALAAQTTVPPPQPTPVPQPAMKIDPPPGRDVIAARVNGQPLSELAIYRGLMRVPAARRDEARKDVLNYHIDNMIVDQYLVQLKLAVEPKEIEEHINKLKKEALAEKQDFQELLKKFVITEDEMRTELTAALRWDKFVLQQAPDKVLQKYFQDNPDMFNGTRVHARHILIPVADGKPEAVQARLAGLKQKIEQETAQSVAKLPSTTDPITREKERAKALEAAFARAASENSTCPSGKNGGDLGFFRRAGDMVEPFARTAFALKPYQMSDPIATDFGYHLILAVEREVGKDVQFDKVKPFVQEVYGERLREAVLGAYKNRAKIEIMPRSR